MLGLLSGGPLAAQTTLYWDTNGGASGGGAGTGNWTGSNWNTNSDGGPEAPGAWISGRYANFSAGTTTTGTFTVTVTGTQDVSGVGVNEGNITFARGGGGGSLNFSDSTPDFAVNSGLSMQVGDGAGAVLIAGSNGLNKLGSGTLRIYGGTHTYSGTTDILNGTLEVAGGATLYNAGTGSGSIVVQGGSTLRAGQDFLGNHASASAVGVTLNEGALFQNTSFVTLNNLTMNGAAMQVADGINSLYQGVQLKGTVTVGGSSASTISSVGGGSIDGVTIGNNTAGGVTTFNVADVTGSASPDLTIAARIINGTTVSGSGGVASGLTKTGGGTLVLAANNSYTGNTTVSSGTLVLQGTTGSPSFNISSGAVLELNAATNINYATNAAAASTTTFSGTGVLRKTGAGQVSWGSKNATFALGSGALIDVQEGTFKGGDSYGEVWTSNLADLNVAAGATFNGAEANVRVDALTGTGTIRSGWNDGGYQNFTFGVDNGSGTFSGALADFSYAGHYVKTGTGTQTLSGASTYTGNTTVNGGTLVANNNAALGATGNTTNVTSGGTLAIGGGITVTKSGMLNLAGSGASGAAGALVSGGAAGQIGQWTGNVTLTANATMGASDNRLIVGNGSSTTIALGGNTLSLNSATATSNVDINSGISGTGGLVKTGPGISTIGGSTANNFTGSFSVQDGTVYLNKSVGVNATGNGNTLIVGDGVGAAGSAIVALSADHQISDATDVTINSDGRLYMGSATDRISQIAGTGRLDLATSSGRLVIGTDDSSSVFDGTISGSGTLVKEGTGSLTLTKDSSYSGGFELNAGTLILDNMDLSVSTLNITGNSTIDFGASGDSHLLVNTLSFLNSSVVLNIVNWTKGVDAFYANFWPGATYDQINNGNTSPMNQIVFQGWSPSDTGWDSYDNQIYPKVPEPSTYGLIFLGASVAFVGYRRWRQSRTKVADRA